MKKNSVTEFELEKQDFKIKLKRGPNGGGVAAGYEDASGTPVVAYASPATALPVAPGAASAAPAAALASTEVEINSPMIGTFARVPSPELGSYIEVCAEVAPD